MLASRNHAWRYAQTPLDEEKLLETWLYSRAQMLNID